MNDSLCFVQFIHPGGEHIPDRGDHITWNRGDHRRKFMKAVGRYMTPAGLREGPLVLWGEWEPESRVLARYAPSEAGMPQYLYEPYFVEPIDEEWRQNTDPYVFGEQFLYTGCKQYKEGRPTQLRNLSPGSVVLFGSRVKSQFALDTVFVVDHYLDHSADNHQSVLEHVIANDYRIVTIEPWYHSPFPPQQGHRLYFGATVDAPIAGMYSFVPCRSYDASSRGFARPAIDLPGRVTPSLKQGQKIAKNLDRHDVERLWNQVASQVTAHGLDLGVGPLNRGAHSLLAL